MTGLALRIAIVHEWISARAGSEKTFEALAEAFPRAELFALTREPGVVLDLNGRPVKTTFLDRVAFARQHRALSLPLMPLAYRFLKTEESYDVVISSSHAFSRSFPPARRSLHLSYIHAPMRYAWTPEIDGRGAGNLLAPARAMLRRMDRRNLPHVDSFAANSTAVRDRVNRFYGQDCRVIYPPVDTSFFASTANRDTQPPRKGLLAVGRLIPYKRFDLAIRVAANLSQPITIVGEGPELPNLKRLAAQLGADAQFVGRLDDHDLREAYVRAQALLFPGIEDFGIIPVEAQAAGTPVVGPRRGGLTDTVVDGRTGVLCRDSSFGALREGTQHALASEFAAADCTANAQRFSRSRFIAAAQDWVSTEWTKAV